ncbi:SNF2 helicase associated domain-containing protein [Chungangia koreensis]|uniref:SNF2 helicase associated domain-containing protein n=1 Tax=Chungangia koreensis TaxID=752657 RepID=A0ABV8WZ93_9LACT
MDIQLTEKKIKDLCGTVAYKKGDSFYRAGKVTLLNEEPETVTATVKGAEEFQVTITNGGTAQFQATCSCPTLKNVRKHCQHIAAVLLALHERQKEAPDDLTSGFMQLFDRKPKRQSGEQRHFEQREQLRARFIVSPVEMSPEDYLIGIRIEVNQQKVQEIRDFLLNVYLNRESIISPDLTVEPSRHYFAAEEDAVLHQLIRVIQDERTYTGTLPTSAKLEVDRMLIPPTSWEILLSLLTKTNPSIEQDGILSKLRISDMPPPVTFKLEEDGEDCKLRITGLNDLIPLPSYNAVFAQGVFHQLKEEDVSRLVDMRRMLNGEDKLPIPEENVEDFIKNILPGLKRIGEASVSTAITTRLRTMPLKAKLYLDRLKNRLLAGVEFHYGQVIIQPLDPNEPAGETIIRDDQKEAQIIQLMKESGFAETEGGYYLQNEELEYEFLFHTLPKLQQLVQVYATTAIRARIVPNTVLPTIRVNTVRTNYLEFTFEMKGIPDAEIKAILAALREKLKYYRLRDGALLSLETKEMDEIRRFMVSVPAQPEDFETMLNMPAVDGLRLLDLIEESDVFQAEQSFKEFTDRLLQPERLDVQLPESMKYLLRDYQKTGYKWLKTLAAYRFGGVLADDMGLGKTIQSIAFIVSELPSIRERKEPVLIVCPSSVTYNWQRELTKFAPDIQSLIIDGSKAERQLLEQDLSGLDVLIMSYPIIRRDIKWAEKQQFHTIFFDEAQAFKNPITQTARAVKRLQADHRFALTGTPIENAPEELWSIYYVVFPQLFGGLREFSNLRKKAITKRVRPFLLRRMKEDVLSELPGKIETVDATDLLPEQKKLYAAYLAKLRHDTLKHLDKDTIRKNRIRILAGLTRLRQICCHPELFIEGYKGGSAKFDQLMQILEDAKRSNRRVLIFSQFTKMLHLIGRELNGRGESFFYLDGQTPSEERVDLCQRFNDGERDLFLISLKAGGTGLNLTGADTVILYDLWWNPAVEVQAADRAYRMGQKNQVNVIKLVSKGTIEEKMVSLQDHKNRMIEDLIGQGDSSKLTEDDIRELLMN